MVEAVGYLPKGTPVDVIGYWFPPDGKGPVGNDLITIPRSSQNPVLAHLFLNYMQDVQVSLLNTSYQGDAQPLTAVTPQRLVHEGLVPPSLISTAVRRSYFRNGLQELALPPSADALWQQAWQSVSHGV
jgi:spermidine/putrescine-binding protein